MAVVCTSTSLYAPTSLCGAEGPLSSSDGEGSFTSTMQSAGKGRGVDGSLASSSPSGGKRDRAEGSLSSNGFPPSKGYFGKGRGGEGSFNSTTRPAGKGLGGDGSCETGTWMGAGKAVQPTIKRATIEERMKSFIVDLCKGKGLEIGK